jgi:trimeric autotransporter adhesin
VAPVSVLSVGALGSERQIQNVAAGVVSASSTDAINGSQLFTVATAANALGSSLATVTGGGLALNPDGTIATAPSITVGGVAYTNTSAAIEAGDVKTSTLGSGLANALGGGASVGIDGTVATVTYAVGGTQFHSVSSAIDALQSGAPVQYSTSGAPTTANGLVPSQSMTLVGSAAGPVSLNNVAAGATTIGSTQAVNGGQINTALGSVADSLGGGSVYDPATGGLTAPSYLVQGSTYANVGAAFAGVSSELTNLKTGAAGLLQFSSAGSNTTPNGGMASQNMTLVGATAGQAVTLSNVAGGSINATSSEAVNGAQLFALGNALGGGSTFGPNGTVTAPNYTVNGSTYQNAGDAFSAINNSLTGGGIRYFHANSTLADSAPLGVDSVAVGPVAGSAGTRSVSIGLNANASASDAVAIGNGAAATGGAAVAIGLGQTATGNGAVAIGDPNTAIGTGAVAIGADNSATGQGAVALGNASTASGQGSVAIGNAAAATLAGSVALGDGSTASAVHAGLTSVNGGVIAATAPTAVLSVGSTGSERQVQNVAAGVIAATSTDAVNGSQLFAAGSAVNAQGTGLAAALGGGAAVAPNGVVTAPSYALSTGTYSNVGSALGALNTAIATINSGSSSLVLQTGGAPSNGQLTLGAFTGGNSVNVAGTSGDRVITGVANGSVASGSTDAVNGAQLSAVQAAAAATSASIGNSVAANLGGGSAYDPATGRVSAPTYTVGGRAYTNVGSALGAGNALAVQYVADAGGQPTNAVRLSGNGNGQPVAVTNVAAGAVTVASTDAVNGGQLYAVQQVADGAVQYDRNPDGSLDRGGVTLGTAGTPVSLRNIAPGVRPTDAANIGQLNAGFASTLTAANAYTDARFATLDFNLQNVAKKAYAGSAAAIALQAPQLFEPGTVAVRFGVGYYRGQAAFGTSIRATSDNGRWSLSGGVSGGANAGVAASAGVDFILGH